MNMRKFKNIMLKTAGIMGVLGVICMIFAFAMGLTADGFLNMLKDGKFAISIKNGQIIKYEEIEITDDEETITDESDSKTNESWQHFLGEDCNSIDLEFGTGVLDIHYDDVEEIQIYHENIKQFKAEVKNGVLKINTGHEVYIDDAENRQLVIVLPVDMKLDKVDMDIAAAMANVDGICANDVKLTIGAGQANVTNVVANEIEVEVGAGMAIISDLEANVIEAKCGMGEITIDIVGYQSDYNCDVDCGMGNVVVDGYSYGGVGTQHHGENHQANKHIDVECGMGEVIVNFMEDFSKI